MPPYAGEGVNMAMQYALELSKCLTNEVFADLQSAIAAYARPMHQQAAEAGQATLASTVMLHSPNAVENLVNFFRSGEVPTEETNLTE